MCTDGRNLSTVRVFGDGINYFPISSLAILAFPPIYRFKDIKYNLIWGKNTFFFVIPERNRNVQYTEVVFLYILLANFQIKYSDVVQQLLNKY